MFTAPGFSAGDKKEFYKELNTCLSGLIGGEPDWLANLANAAALLYQSLPDINWAGFYRYRSGELILGPFQGKPACVRIPVGKGVCGTAAATGEIQIVEDVERFPGHIACDADSRSEIVIPIRKAGRLIGILDIDSPEEGRFDRTDAEGLIDFVDLLYQHIDWP